jgi:hypothetical protein
MRAKSLQSIPCNATAIATCATCARCNITGHMHAIHAIHALREHVPPLASHEASEELKTRGGNESTSCHHIVAQMLTSGQREPDAKVLGVKTSTNAVVKPLKCQGFCRKLRLFSSSADYMSHLWHRGRTGLLGDNTAISPHFSISPSSSRNGRVAMPRTRRPDVR